MGSWKLNDPPLTKGSKPEKLITHHLSAPAHSSPQILFDQSLTQDKFSPELVTRLGILSRSQLN